MLQSSVSLRERILLDHTSAVPLHRQIYQWVRRAILDGQLQPRQQLPSTQTLASELGVSRNTASTAYEELQAEGYIERTIGSWTKVAPFFPERRPSDLVSSKVPSNASTPISSLDLSPFGRAIAEQMRSVPAFLMQLRSSEPRAFRLGMPALGQFPYHLWAQLIARHARRSLPRQSDYQESAGYRPLREAIAAHIAVTRGVRCQAEHLLITSGAQAALDLAVRRRGRTFIRTRCTGSKPQSRLCKSGAVSRRTMIPSETNVTYDTAHLEPLALYSTIVSYEALYLRAHPFV